MYYVVFKVGITYYLFEIRPCLTSSHSGGSVVLPASN